MCFPYTQTHAHTLSHTHTHTNSYTIHHQGGCTKDGVVISTEYMFKSSEERLNLMRTVLVAETDIARTTALTHLRDIQRVHFQKIFRSCIGVPVFITLLDTSLDTFLPPYGDNQVYISEIRDTVKLFVYCLENIPMHERYVILMSYLHYFLSLEKMICFL